MLYFSKRLSHSHKPRSTSYRHGCECGSVSRKCLSFKLSRPINNAPDIIEGYDFILDCTDNFRSKFMINDVCVLLGKPFCHAGIQGFSGQVMTYTGGDEPCYRCIFGDVPDEDSVPAPSSNGVIGAVAGVIGSIQALEAIKFIVGTGELLTGKMLTFDALTMKARIAAFHGRNSECKVCSTVHGGI